jgi:hypothetical protein
MDVKAHTHTASKYSRIKQWLDTGRHQVGMDRAVSFTILARGWSSASGLVTVGLIAHFLSSAEQGYYYTFASLIALQIVFELGFSQVVMQLASHELAHLTICPDGTVSGDETAHARLSSVLQISVRWYGAGALLFGALAIPAGIYFFSSHQHLGTVPEWRAPWIAAAVAAVVAFFLDPIYSFFEGCGFVPEVAHMRLMQAIVGSAMAWTSLATGHGLYAPAMVITGQILVGAIWVFGKRQLLEDLLSHSTLGQAISWRSEIWPFQWRIAISWISGYFVYQTFNPFLFALQGPAAAGQMGMSLSFANSLMLIAIAWVSTKGAPFGTLIARKRYGELDRLFFKSLLQSCAVAGLGAIVIWSGWLYLHSTHSRYSRRLLDPLPFALLLLAAMANHIFACMGTYLRAHKQEPLFRLSLAIAVTVVFSNYFFAKTSGAAAMVTGYLVIIGSLGLGGGTLLFIKHRRLWHSDGQNS